MLILSVRLFRPIASVKKTFCRLLITFLAEQKVNRLAEFVHRASVINEHRRSRLHIDSQVAREIGDSHEYDLFES